MPEHTQELKLNRTDVARLVALQVQEQVDRDVGATVAATVETRELFHRQVIIAAKFQHVSVLVALAGAVGYPNLHARCTYHVHDGEDGGSTADVVFSDSERSYQGRCMLTVTVELDECLRGLRDDWQVCVRMERVAAERDRRMSAVGKDARDEIIRAALATEGGAELLAIAKKVAAVVTVDLESKQ